MEKSRIETNWKTLPLFFPDHAPLSTGQLSFLFRFHPRINLRTRILPLSGEDSWCAQHSRQIPEEKESPPPNQSI